MGIVTTNNTVTADCEEIDIYAAIEMKEALLGLIEAGMEEAGLDLSRARTLSTPAAQVIVSAVRSFKKLDFIGEVQESLNEDLRSIGIEI